MAFNLLFPLRSIPRLFSEFMNNSSSDPGIKLKLVFTVLNQRLDLATRNDGWVIGPGSSGASSQLPANRRTAYSVLRATLRSPVIAFLPCCRADRTPLRP
jgi:hypothetical protein